MTQTFLNNADSKFEDSFYLCRHLDIPYLINSIHCTINSRSRSITGD